MLYASQSEILPLHKPTVYDKGISCSAGPPGARRAGGGDAMARHSFIRMSKLKDVCGRVDYISNPKRQEHLYATYSTVESEFWQHLSEQAQYDFWKSNQPTGKCIEARELIIALPESLQQSDSDLLLKLFTEKFRTEYGMQCTAALHHNKTKTNYHIHLIFADRDVLEKTEVKYATRNMFYNEDGRHVRTKKEILDEEGNVRPGCRILPKGEPYEINWFSGRKDIFKSKKFLSDVKVMFTDLINQCVSGEEDKLTVFDPSGPYLPTKKIGKNNPLEEEIRADNELRQEWNRTVDQVLIAGGTEADVTSFKDEEVVKKISFSRLLYGNEPGMFAGILQRAIAILKEFLKLLMEPIRADVISLNDDELVEPEIISKSEKKPEPEMISAPEMIQNPQIASRVEMTSEPAVGKEPRPDSTQEELEFMSIDAVHQKLRKCNGKLYALQKKKQTAEADLDTMPRSIFNRKERKILVEQIEGLQRQIDKTRTRLDQIPQEHGFGNVREVNAAYKNAKTALEAVREKQAEWDGIADANPLEHRQTQRQKESVLKRLAEKQIKLEEAERLKQRKQKQWKKKRCFDER